MFNADLHVHTDISDSSLSINEVLDLARENNVDIISITNHDTTKGLEEAIKIGIEKGIHVIPGIEISAYDYKRNRKVHLLGYNFNIEASNINNICEKLLNDRNNLSLKQIEILKSLGYEIELKNIQKYANNSKVIYKQHIMMELINKGYTDEIYSSQYKELFKNNGPCCLEIDYIDVFRALEAIKADGGIAVLAHPGQLKSYELLEELVESGLDGVEKYHISHTTEDYKIIDELVDKYKIITTGGSDYHGIYGKESTIGSFVTPTENVKLFIERI